MWVVAARSQIPSLLTVCKNQQMIPLEPKKPAKKFHTASARGVLLSWKAIEMQDGLYTTNLGASSEFPTKNRRKAIS